MTVLKSIQFQFFLISLKRRISLFSNSPSILRGFQLTEKFLGSFSLVQSVEKLQWMFEREVSRQYNTLSLFTDISNRPFYAEHFLKVDNVETEHNLQQTVPFLVLGTTGWDLVIRKRPTDSLTLILSHSSQGQAELPRWMIFSLGLM